MTEKLVDGNGNALILKMSEATLLQIVMKSDGWPFWARRHQICSLECDGLLVGNLVDLAVRSVVVRGGDKADGDAKLLGDDDVREWISAAAVSIGSTDVAGACDRGEMAGQGRWLPSRHPRSEWMNFRSRRSERAQSLGLGYCSFGDFNKISFSPFLILGWVC